MSQPSPALNRRARRHGDASLALSVSIGAAIRDARKARGWKQSHVGKLVGVSQAAVGQWERGETLPRAELLIALATLLDFDVRGAA